MSFPGTIISVQNVYSAYNRNTVLKEISLTIKINERWAIIGKNGTGKSTLLKTVASIIKPSSGNIFINGKNIFSCNHRERARLLAYVPQKPEGNIPYTVYDFIMLGRYSAMGMFSLPQKNDHDKVMDAATICDVKHLCHRIMGTLSGGELQRVLLAGAVAQQTKILLLDEPTSYLDPAHERFFLNALSRVQEQQDLTIMMVTHDINTALSCCTHICGLIDGKVAFSGTSETFKSKCPDILQELYGLSFTKYFSPENELQVYGAWGKDCILEN